MKHPTSDALAAAERRGELRARRQVLEVIAFVRSWSLGYLPTHAAARLALDETTKQARKMWRESDRKRRKPTRKGKR